MNRLLIYGIGTAFEKKIDFLNKKEIVAFVDKDPKKIGMLFLGKLVISPNEISNYEFDKIVVSSVKYLEEIISELICIHHIDKSKIISIYHYIEIYNLKRNYIGMEKKYIFEYLNDKEYCKLIDVSGYLQSVHYINDDKIIDAVCVQTTNNREIVYNKAYENTNQILPCGYDVLVAIAPFINFTVEEFLVLIGENNVLFKTIIITVPYIGSGEYDEWARYDFNSLGCVTCHNQFTSKLLIIEIEKKMIKENSAMFTVTHKKFDVPINHKYYNIIHAGCKNNFELGFIGDNSGQNISSYNNMINECTALYWLWKNDRRDYLGLCHYRRYFVSQHDNEKIIMQEELAEILNKCDIIVAQRENFYPLSVKEQLAQTMSESALETTIVAVKNAILNKQPMYADAFDYVLNGYEMFPCNMFFANKKIINLYCEWLFSFILEVCDCVDLSEYDDYSKRAVGFVAERLFTVWLCTQTYRIKEIPIKIFE